MGGRVLATLKGKRRLGLVTGFPKEAPLEPKEIEEILDPLPVLPREDLHFYRWVADYHLAPLGQVIKYAMPSGLFRLPKKKPPLPFEGPLDKAPSGPGFSPLLLHEEDEEKRKRGYLDQVEDIFKHGRKVLWLVPERKRAESLAQELSSRYQLILYHGGLSSRRRVQIWFEVLAGEYQLLIGTRSALFLPARGLGLILVEDEEDEAYKEEQAFRYQARDLALIKAKLEKIKIVLGSAAPSVKSYFWARKGKYELLQGEIVPPPKLTLVDLAQERGFLSQRLLNACRLTLGRGKQVFFFVNRLGYSTVLQCQSCGHVWRCPECESPLRYHQEERVLKCHFCRYLQPAPPLCPACQGEEIKFLGMGIERVIEMLERFFPEASLARIDQETARQDLDWDQIDFLVGTKKAGLRPPLPRLGLIVVVLADQFLCLPHFRAAEKAYQTLKKLALNPCPWLLIQTFHPEHHVFQGLRLGYESFFQAEIDLRRRLKYPPFTRMVQVSWEGKKKDRLQKRVEETLNCLDQEALLILGPREEKKKGLFSYRLLLKGDHETLHQALRACLPSEEKGIKLDLDWDPD